MQEMMIKQDFNMMWGAKLMKYKPSRAFKRLLKNIINNFKIYYEKKAKWEEFKKDFNNFKSKTKNERFQIKWENISPCLDDKTQNTDYGSHYTLHPAWAARILKKINPVKLVDIASYTKFNAIISAFIPVDFYDYRPAKIELSNMLSTHADITKLPFEDKSIQTLSCMHVIEHIGLGRYGDPIDPEGDIKAITELIRVLAIDGNLLFAVPLANEPKIRFNSERIYSHEQIMEYFSGLKLIEFSIIADFPDNYKIITNPSPALLKKQQYACGCYWFKKEL